jgi:hypothetical protein
LRRAWRMLWHSWQRHFVHGATFRGFQGTICAKREEY